MNGGFTGRHALMVIGGGFTIVIAVNLTLAVLATRSHPGMVVENSYVASQNFNQWLEAGRAQKALGWTVEARAEKGLIVVDAASALQKPLTGLTGEVTVTHPLGAEPARTLALEEMGDGRYAAGPLPRGQWIAEIRLNRGGQPYYLKTRLTGEG
nr:FixH family protein [Sandaracinobacteroides sayramensis]